MTQESDADNRGSRLADAVVAGEASAEDELVRIYGPRVYAIALSRTGDPEVAQDLAQDVMLAVLEALRNNKLDHRTRLPGFILGTTRNLINNFFRRRKDTSSDTDALQSAVSSWPDWQLAERQRRSQVRAALTWLSDVDQQILGLTLAQGLKPAEIAERLGLDHDVVRQRKTRAIRKITERLNESSQTQHSNHKKAGPVDEL